MLITAVSDLIDRYTGRHFTSISEDRYFDGTGIKTLFLGEDLLSVTSISNGGEDLTSDEYLLYPLNSLPKRYITIKTEVGKVFERGKGNITIAGNWGYCDDSSRPYDIWNAAVELTCREYIRRTSAYANVMLDPKVGEVRFEVGLPKDIAELLDAYCIVTISG